MTTEILSILSQYGQSTTDRIKSVIPNATGKTAKSLRFEVKEDGSILSLRIVGRPYFMSLQTGRRPTRQGSPKGDPTLVDAIKEWLEAKGLPGNAYAIAKNIHEKGTKLYRQGGNTIITDIVNQSLVDKISEDVLKEFARYYLVSTVNLFNGNGNQSATRA